MTIPAVAQALQVLFGLHDIRTLAALTPEKGLALLAQEPVDLVIADMNFSADTTSGEEGTALFRALRAHQPDLPVILLTAWTHLESAVQLVKAGAADYIGKPWDNDKLLATVENLLELAEATRERRLLQEEQRRRRERLAEQYDLCGIVFASDTMERVVELACRVARADVRVLITGPNGAGKERIARDRACQLLGTRAAPSSRSIAAPFPPSSSRRSCSAPRPAPTRERTARAPAASNWRMAAPCSWTKSAICRSPARSSCCACWKPASSRCSARAGRTPPACGCVSATNADLPALIREGRFREDLYYRLNVIEVTVPPLAERPADILPLARHFLGSQWSLSDDAEAALLAHDWPGNVRELRNSIERAKLLGRDSRVTATDLNLPAVHRTLPEGETSRRGAEAGQWARSDRDVEQPSRELIEASLREAGGNISRAAQSLGLSRQALYRRMERFNLRP